MIIISFQEASSSPSTSLCLHLDRRMAIMVDEDIILRGESPTINDSLLNLSGLRSPKRDSSMITRQDLSKLSIGSYGASTTTPEGASATHSVTASNFFSLEVFQIVLHNPATSYQMEKFCNERRCGENISFLLMVCPSRQLRTLLSLF
jgi:hypothetical protein